MTAPRAASIGDHAVVGDGRAVALVDRSGTVDWMTLPEDPHTAVFDALLAPGDGGRFRLGPVADSEVSRRYRPDSMVLETTFRTVDGELVVTDCFTRHDGARLPWVELARRVRCTVGRVELVWSVEPNMVLGRSPSALAAHHEILQVEVEGLRLGLLHWGVGEPTLTERGASGATGLRSGDEALMALVVVRDEPLPRPDRGEVTARIDRTVETWQGWSHGIEYEGRWREQVHQSARALKLLIHEPDGAVMAAPTTSLPERAGGPKNYDYRFCWVRDASFTIDALLRIGLVEEAHQAVAALLRMAAQTAPDLAPFYRADGTVPDEAHDVDLPGYRGSQPVQEGNAAAGQLQLGSWGDLFEAVWIYVRQGNDLDQGTGRLMSRLADRVCEIWRREDAGMWELPQARHYTVSKLRCWMALDRALRLAEADQLDGDLDRWRAEQAAVRSFIEDRCWSEARCSLAFHADTDDLDASCLLAARVGFVAGDSEVALGTLAAVQEELVEGPFVWRYSGERTEEGAFVACSFWLADALLRAGRVAEAEDVVDGALLGVANDLGLMSEEHAPSLGEMRGNFPQGLSHLALISAASLHAEVLEARG